MASTKFKYLFNSDDYDSGNGKILYDNSDNNADATYTNSSFSGSDTWSTDIPYNVSTPPLNLTDSSNIGKQLGPYSFNFTTARYFNHNLTSSWSGSFTFTIWFKPTETMHRWDSLFSSSDDSSNTNTWQLDSNGSGTIRILVNGGGGNYDINSYSINTWQHVAISFKYDETLSNRELKVYYNSVLTNTYTSSTDTALLEGTNFSFEKYKIGKNRDTDKNFAGFITGVMLFDSVLNSSQISNIYNYNSISGSAVGDPHINTLFGKRYKFDYLGPFRMFDNNGNGENKIVINGISENGEAKRWKNKQYIRYIYFYCGGKSMLINTGFRGIPVKVIENYGFDYTEKDLNFDIEKAKHYCFDCKKKFNILKFNKYSVQNHINKTGHKNLKPIRNSISFFMKNKYESYLIEITNVDELNIQPCEINIYPIKTNYDKISGLIVNKKYSKNCIIPNIKYLGKTNIKYIKKMYKNK